MKKIVVIMALFAAVSSNAQVDYPESSGVTFAKSNELRLGVIRLLSGNSLDIGYERIIDRNQSYGANLLIGFEDYDYEFNQKFSVSPYYRFYFNKSQEYGAKGMFVEGFADFYSGKGVEYDNGYYIPYPDSGYGGYYNYPTKNFFDVALGVALGWKWVNTAGFVFELKGGYGRNILNQNPNNDGIFRGDVSIGYRF